MKRLLRQSFHWHPVRPAWGAALVAGFGCALPLLLGLFSGHPGFLWATVGAFQAAKANPLHRFGMLRMLLLIALGACSAGLGFWSATHPLISLGLFAFFGLLLAWLQRYGSEAGKLGIGLAICLCLGQGQYGIADFNNPYAIAVLFALGGLWVTLLAFGLRGMHGLRMWPYMPRLMSILRVLRRHARRTPIRQWRAHALTYMLAAALGGVIVNLAGLPRGYWLTLAVFTTLQMDLEQSLVRALQAGIGIFAAAAILIYLGHGLADPPLMVMILLPLVVLGRAFQANHYGLFVLQTTLLFLLLAETLAQDWNLPQTRLLNAAIGVGLALLVASLMHLVRRLLTRRSRKNARAAQQPEDQTISRS
ncbi:family membrane protein [Pseudomonas sp. BAY1663]|uniref:FUSC family protein n=1 Tax=Pseudomonas sp. BAY1663 TaxID=1439940 RepID=UPI00042E1135|nr:FUSC family protein [Pseudomonas sp. BAY1663]EXF47449.1 family membrane protein [Pseudomonas sp. BAY1663]